MRLLKILYLCILAIVFISSKSHSSFSLPLINNYSIEKGDNAKQIGTITNQSQDDDSQTKRNRKPRGIEVDVPQISDISFEQSFAHTRLKYTWIDNIYSFNEYYVHGKRGPPLV